MTPHREEKISNVLLKRQPDLTVMLENVLDPHNISAVLRSCDAVGVQEVYVLNEGLPRPKKFGRKTSSGSKRWVEVNYFKERNNCIEALRSRFQNIYALSADFSAKTIYDVDFTGSTALIFGNEKEGLHPETVKLADACITIPMTGMVSSLNISVACAVSLYEAYRQRQLNGMYDRKNMLPEQSEIYKKWVMRELRRARMK